MNYVIMGQHYPATVDGFISGLNDGHRRFMMGVNAMSWNKTLDLDNWSSDRELVIVGSAPHLSHLNRAFASGPLIRADTLEWSVTFQGLTFWGNRTNYATSEPLVDIKHARNCYFESCLFAENYGHGLRLGSAYGGHTNHVQFLACKFQSNSGYGLEIRNSTGVIGATMISCVASGNNDVGVVIYGGGHYQGALRIMGCAFVDNDDDYKVGLYLRDVEAGNVENCYFVRNNLDFNINTKQLIAERNLFLSSSFLDFGTSNSSVGNSNV